MFFGPILPNILPLEFRRSTFLRGFANSSREDFLQSSTSPAYQRLVRELGTTSISEAVADRPSRELLLKLRNLPGGALQSIVLEANLRPGSVAEVQLVGVSNSACGAYARVQAPHNCIREFQELCTLLEDSLCCFAEHHEHGIRFGTNQISMVFRLRGAYDQELLTSAVVMSQSRLVKIEDLNVRQVIFKNLTLDDFLKAGLIKRVDIQEVEAANSISRQIVLS